MSIEIQFLGAAQNVTGSRYLLKTAQTRLLVDCGLYQEHRLQERNWQPFDISQESLSAVLISHAHIDHCGLLPKLVKDGFSGPVFATEATAEIARISLADAGKLQEEDAAFKKKRHEHEGRKTRYLEIPLYTAEDAKAVFPLFNIVEYSREIPVSADVTATFHNAGHVFGSASIELRVTENNQHTVIAFSGDLGNWNRPILKNPDLIDQADYIVIESTYGDRTHEDINEASLKLADIINQTIQRGGNIVIPSFALERTQDLLYFLNRFMSESKIPRLKVFVDSPMAISITKIFTKYPELYDRETAGRVKNGSSPFEFEGLYFTNKAADSKAILSEKAPCIIIAGSGMCTGGRIKHHLVNNISRPESTILFVGFQAIGTLGRLITDGAKEVRILGQYYPVRAHIQELRAFSAHADQPTLLRWLRGFKNKPKRVFVTHGEPETSETLIKAITETFSWEATAPEYQEIFNL
ncbi:MBL fold metallo-hydrolase [Dehalococcoides sp. THU3]|uniref:MBL fold metallo-hydrolase RNA specificity domain-containing protein n=1 Tax=Dehalococcoides TaxID=61434 RepID=UPI0005B573E4|nr:MULTISPECIES: MBL fold metallo-hydrolase [Dehalococcoides]QYY57884.1 MBL fold metallo-hydrolase [Dehalococcoides mccartyi]BAQ34853.1 ribonuclease [Dehalococcoides sp. UCH007]